MSMPRPDVEPQAPDETELELITSPQDGISAEVTKKRLNIGMPSDLHGRAERSARVRGISFTEYVESALTTIQLIEQQVDTYFFQTTSPSVRATDGSAVKLIWPPSFGHLRRMVEEPAAITALSSGPDLKKKNLILPDAIVAIAETQAKQRAKPVNTIIREAIERQLALEDAYDRYGTFTYAATSDITAEDGRPVIAVPKP
jgi:predicted HicB family RNase H-like nuclease